MIDYTGHTIDDKYRLTRLIGEGGMGIVYRGEHLLIEREVAVKFLHSSLIANPEAVRRFFREARAAGKIGHQNVIDVLDVGVSGSGDPYLVMEYLGGEELKDVLERTGPLNLATTCAILEPTLLALHAAHKKNIVHRDLKPDNIFIVKQDDEAPLIKIIDFGISKISEANGKTQLTQDGTLLGTPAYMSPEQARGSSNLDHRTDLYAVGVICYQCLTGQLPFEGDNYNELLVNVITEDLVPPKTAYADFPDKATSFIERALAKEPDDRFQSAREMLDALGELADVNVRSSQLSELGTDLSDDSVATGNLGLRANSRERVDASEVLAEVFRERNALTFKEFARDWRTNIKHWRTHLQYAKESFPIWIRSPRTIRRLVAVGLASLLLTAGIVALTIMPPMHIGEVKLYFDGLPKEGRIYYDDHQVTDNPFYVESQDTIVQLRVEAPNFKELKLSVVPNEDQVVDLDLRWKTARGTSRASVRKMSDLEQEREEATERDTAEKKAAAKSKSKLSKNR